MWYITQESAANDLFLSCLVNGERITVEVQRTEEYYRFIGRDLLFRARRTLDVVPRDSLSFAY